MLLIDSKSLLFRLHKIVIDILVRVGYFFASWLYAIKIVTAMVKEYNELADRYNKLIDDKVELERKNREKTYEVMYRHERNR